MDNSLNGITILAKGTKVKGNIFAKGDIRIDGNVEGKVECSGKVVLGDQSSTEIDVDTESIDLNGAFKGAINASKQINIGPQGNISGELVTPSLVVEKGAVINSEIKMDTRPPHKKSDAK